VKKGAPLKKPKQKKSCEINQGAVKLKSMMEAIIIGLTANFNLTDFYLDFFGGQHPVLITWYIIGKILMNHISTVICFS